MLGVQIGQTKSQLLKVMGNPYKTEAYVIDGETVEFWLYITQATDSDGFGDNNFTPFCFNDGKLAGYGRNFYNRVIESKQDISITVD